MATYYHVRLLAASGERLEAHTIKTLSKAVGLLNRLTGIEWPYQVIHRTLKSGVWAESCVVPSAATARCIAVIEDAGHRPGLGSDWWEQNPGHPARRGPREAAQELERARADASMLRMSLQTVQGTYGRAA